MEWISPHRRYGASHTTINVRSLHALQMATANTIGSFMALRDKNTSTNIALSCRFPSEGDDRATYFSQLFTFLSFCEHFVEYHEVILM